MPFGRRNSRHRSRLSLDSALPAPEPMREQAQSSSSSDSETPARGARSLGVPLAPVHEANRGASPRRPPPSAFRGLRGGAPGPAKGKDRCDAGPLQQRIGRAPWVIDTLEAHRGAEVWRSSPRTILVLGEPSRAALEPLLYSPAFAETLILVGSISPLPEIEALNSPSHLLSTNDGRTIYPTVQPFRPSTAVLTEAPHPHAAILAQGAALAEEFRRNGGPTTDLSGPAIIPRSRRGSFTSTRSGAATPPGTPPRRKRLLSFGRGSSNASPAASPGGSVLDLTRFASSSRAPSVSDGDDRPSLQKRISSLFRDEVRVAEGSAIDAVINFIPPAPLSFDQQRAMREMLQNTVVLTTAVLPILTAAVTTNSAIASLQMSEIAPLSLIHVVPNDAPPALAPVIERFLLPLIPTMGARVKRDLFGVVTGYGAWLATYTDPANDGRPGAEVLLFGGVRCLPNPDAETYRPQAMLAGWDHCQPHPGTLVSALSERETSPQAFSRRASSMALSEIRAAHAGHPVASSASVTTARSTPSPPSSPQLPPPAASFPTSNHPAPTPTSALPPGAAAPRSTSPVAPISPTSGPAAPKRTKSPGAPLYEPSQAFTSRFDPRYRESNYAPTPLSTSNLGQSPPTSPTAASPNPTATSPRSATVGHSYNSFTPSALRSSPASPDLASAATLGTTKSLPSVPRVSEMGHLSPVGTAQKKPSGLRNSFGRLQPSPPTPELDPSSSSCSSSSVMEPAFDERKAVPKVEKKGIVGSRTMGFSSLFKRRGVKA